MTIRPAILFHVLACSALGGILPAAADPVPEYEIKAAFLYNFARYTQWPEAHGDPSKFQLCIIGRDPFGKALASIEDKKINDLPIAIHYPNELEDIKKCRMLYLGEQNHTMAKKLLDKLAKLPILTVTDTDGLVAQGVMLGMKLEDRHIAIEANATAAEDANLTISSKLLRLAYKVY